MPPHSSGPAAVTPSSGSRSPRGAWPPHRHGPPVQLLDVDFRRSLNRKQPGHELTAHAGVGIEQELRRAGPVNPHEGVQLALWLQDERPGRLPRSPASLRPGSSGPAGSSLRRGRPPARRRVRGAALPVPRAGRSTPRRWSRPPSSHRSVSRRCAAHRSRPGEEK